MSVWRHLAMGGLSRRAARLSDGMTILREHRDGSGRWQRFPFYYTLLALTECGGRVGHAEILYAAPALARTRQAAGEKYALRRRALAERIRNAI